MSADDKPTDEEIEAKREELLEDTRQARQESEEKQQALLDAVSSDGDLGDTDTAQIGDLEVRHKSYIPGDQLRKVRQTQQAMQSGGDVPDDADELDLLVDLTEALYDDTTKDTYTGEETIRTFWQGYIDTYGTDAYATIFERILQPLLEDTEEKMSGLQSFPGEQEGDGLRRGNVDDRNATE